MTSGSKTAGYRARALLPKLGVALPKGPILLDTNVFINALAGRGPPALKTLLAGLPLSLVSGPTIGELAWTRGRLDPDHPGTARALDRIDDALARIPPTRILTADEGQWERAGELAGRAARAIAGETRSMRTAFDRIELINDAVTAIVALDAGATIVTQDGDFDLFMQIEPELGVLFYE